jgi:Xaa-Pro aminopeptidase
MEVQGVAIDRLHPFELSAAERDRRWGAARALMAERGLDALLVWGSSGAFAHCNASMRWLTNVNTEGYLAFPAEGDPALFSFENGLNPAWVTDWRGAVPDFAKAIAAHLRDVGLGRGRLGLVPLSGLYAELNGFPHATYVRLAERLPGAALEDATELVEGLRRRKSDEEVEALRCGCEMVRRVFDAIRGTARPGVRDYEVRAAIMDTLFRAGSEPGSMILYCQGKHAIHGGQSGIWYEPPYSNPLAEGDVILLELDAVCAGYKAQFNHGFTVGEVDEEWGRVFATAETAYRAGLDALRPGLTVGELEDVMLAPLQSAGFVWGNPAFHGLGLALELPLGTYPRVSWRPDREERLEAGMVLEFEPHPVSPSFTRGASVGCPVLVTDEGCRPIPEWYEPRPIAVGENPSS